MRAEKSTPRRVDSPVVLCNRGVNFTTSLKAHRLRQVKELPMPIEKMIDVLDRLNPKMVTLHWLLDDDYFIVEAIKIPFSRKEHAEVTTLLKARGFELSEWDIDSRGGMEGEEVYRQTLP